MSDERKPGVFEAAGVSSLGSNRKVYRPTRIPGGVVGSVGGRSTSTITIGSGSSPWFALALAMIAVCLYLMFCA